MTDEMDNIEEPPPPGALRHHLNTENNRPPPPPKNPPPKTIHPPTKPQSSPPKTSRALVVSVAITALIIGGAISYFWVQHNYQPGSSNYKNIQSLGQSKGFGQGQEDGYRKGLKQGATSGERKGFELGRQEGLKTGTEKGRQVGIIDGANGVFNNQWQGGEWFIVRAEKGEGDIRYRLARPEIIAPNKTYHLCPKDKEKVCFSIKK